MSINRPITGKTKGEAMTVAELREWLKEIPDRDVHGELAEVWIETGETVSSQCATAMGLNARKDEHGQWRGDVILGILGQ